ncbi:hypothetical protein ACS0TY_031094 [Phlomoides rotata]
MQDKWCVFCGTYLETAWHTFFNCHFSKDYWRALGMSYTIERCILSIDCTKDLILTLIEELGSDEAAKFGAVQRTVGKAATARPCLASVAWHTPFVGKLKVNVDAVFFGDSMQTGFGMTLRDDQGGFVAAKTVVYHCRLDFDIGEAMGFMEALSWVKNLGLQNFVVEGDVKTVVKAINLKTEGVSTFYDVISVCNKLISVIVNCSVSFAKCEANIMAHTFAQVSRVHESPSYWFDPPNFVVGLPVSVCSCGA